MISQRLRSQLTKRRLRVQALEKRRLLAADFAMELSSELDFESTVSMHNGGIFASAVPGGPMGGSGIEFDFDANSGLFTEGQLQELDGRTALLEQGIWIEDASTISAADFGMGFVEFEMQSVDEFQLAEFNSMGAWTVVESMPGVDAGWSPLDMVPQSPLEQAQAELELYDTNEDGLASREEIASAYSSMFGLRDVAANGAADGLLGEFDSDDDQALAVSELVVAYYQELAQAELDSLDADANGLATAEEIADAYVGMYGLRDAAATGAAEGMLDAYDTNEDKGLDLSELTSSYVVDLDANGEQKLGSEDIAVNGEVLGTGEAFELDGDLTPEELAEALGVPVDTIEIIDAQRGTRTELRGHRGQRRSARNRRSL